MQHLLIPFFKEFFILLQQYKIIVKRENSCYYHIFIDYTIYSEWIGKLIVKCIFEMRTITYLFYPCLIKYIYKKDKTYNQVTWDDYNLYTRFTSHQ